MDELNIKLIDLVESEPCIYDKTDVFYSNKDHVKQVWEKISNDMQLSVPVCQKRWRYLRDYFVRQLHMSKTDNKKSYWALFDRMLFLAPFSTRKTRVNTTSSDCCTTTTTTTTSMISTTGSTAAMSKKRRQRSSSAIINKSKNWENDQNILSVSSSSSNAGIDEFNSFDYLNLYQAQFGFADNAALLQLQKQTNFPLNLDDRLSSLPLEIQIRSPSSEPSNNIGTINFSKRPSSIIGGPSVINDDFGKIIPNLKTPTGGGTTISTTTTTTGAPTSSSKHQSNSDSQNLIGYNLVSTSTNEQISTNTSNDIENNNNSNNINRQQRQHNMRNKNFSNHNNDINYKLTDFPTNYQNSALLAVESHYSNSEKSPTNINNGTQNDDDLKFYNSNYNNNINNHHNRHHNNSHLNNNFSSTNKNEKRNNIFINESIDDDNDDYEDNNDNNNDINNKICGAEDLRKIDYKNNSTKISPKMKRSTTRKRKKSEILNELLEILRKSENTTTNCDEHDYFFRSLLNSVRRIDEHLIIPFRTEILKTVMKFREMSDNNNSNNNNNGNNNIKRCSNNNNNNNNNDNNDSSNINHTNNNNNRNNKNQQFNSIFNSANAVDYDDDEDVVIIDTGESNWRQKLKRY